MEPQASLGRPEAPLAPGPLFLVSMGRGGSSLLYALLNKHPQVALMFEADLMGLRSMFHKPLPDRHWTRRWSLFNNAPRRHGLTRGDLADVPSDFVGAFTTTHQLFARRKGASIWGDKSPFYFDRLNRVADDFPHARFIILWRNPKDTANAVLRAAADGALHFQRRGAVLREFLGYEILKEECDRLVSRGKPVCQINYEDLVSDTKGVMQKVCDFLDISYNDEVSQLKGANRSAIYSAAFHTLIRGDAIVQTPRPEHTGYALRRKIAAYIAHWHQLYGASWPPYPQSAGALAHSPRPLQRMIDRTLCRIFRARDLLTRLAFAFAPIAFLEWHRRRRRLPAESPREA